MAPPFLDPDMSGTTQSYAHTFPQSSFARPQPKSRLRHDSMLSRAKIDPVYLDASPYTGGLSDASQKTASQSTRRTLPQKSDSFRFLVTTNPTQFKDKTLMQGNRKHVMKDFLRKERCKTPGTRDIRAEGPVEVDKRRRLVSDAKKAKRSTRNLAPPTRVLDTGVMTPQSSNDGAASSMLYGSDTEYTVTTSASRTVSHLVRHAGSNPAVIPHPVVDDQENDEQRERTCGGGGGVMPYPMSCNCLWPEQDGQDLGVPDLFSVLGFKVSPYHTWLQSANTAVDLEKLKYACGRRLRSISMAKLWLPNLIRARHSFLSTICISAAHDEAMQRVVFGSESLSLRGSKKAVVYERLAVKSEVIAMINASLDDPEQRTSDATIIAVLNMLNSEIIGCDPGALKAHQEGLNKMISIRGGLDKLGVLGHLARTTSITMLNAVLQEEAADDMYLLYAYAQAVPPPLDGTLFPESPIYCAREFATVARILGRGSESLRLLELLQKMTCVFLAEGQPNTEALKYFHRQVLSFKRKLHVGQCSRQDRIYEAIRLTGRLYADALLSNMEFSQASSFSTQRYNSSSEHAASPVVFVEIVRHLMHTDLDRMWGALSGILFFVVMVAGAAARRAQVEDLTEAADLVNEREAEEARRWLAAVAVRCSIILGFEHGGVLLGTLKTMLYIQDKLSGRRRVAIGPDRRAAPQNGFGDFAWEFLAGEK